MVPSPINFIYASKYNRYPIKRGISNKIIPSIIDLKEDLDSSFFVDFINFFL
jgi:hypothetical protein